jgi:hypothetical protein
MSVTTSGQNGDLHRLLESLHDLSVGHTSPSIPPPNTQVRIHITKRYRDCDALALNVNAVQDQFDVVVSENFSLCEALLAHEPFLKWRSFSGNQETDDFYWIVTGRTYSETKSRIDGWAQSLLHNQNRVPFQLKWIVRPQYPPYKHPTPFRLPQPRPSRVSNALTSSVSHT